jgi:hypothetical protein
MQRPRFPAAYVCEFVSILIKMIMVNMIRLTPTMAIFLKAAISDTNFLTETDCFYTRTVFVSNSIALEHSASQQIKCNYKCSLRTWIVDVGQTVPPRS